MSTFNIIDITNDDDDDDDIRIVPTAQLSRHKAQNSKNRRSTGHSRDSEESEGADDSNAWHGKIARRLRSRKQQLQRLQLDDEYSPPTDQQTQFSEVLSQINESSLMHNDLNTLHFNLSDPLQEDDPAINSLNAPPSTSIPSRSPFRSPSRSRNLNQTRASSLTAQQQEEEEHAAILGKLGSIINIGSSSDTSAPPSQEVVVENASPSKEVPDLFENASAPITVSEDVHIEENENENEMEIENEIQSDAQRAQALEVNVEIEEKRAPDPPQENNQCAPIPMDTEHEEQSQPQNQQIESVDESVNAINTPTVPMEEAMEEPMDNSVDNSMGKSMDKTNDMEFDPIQVELEKLRQERARRERAEQEHRENMKKEMEVQRQKEIVEKQRRLLQQQERDRQFRARFRKRQRENGIFFGNGILCHILRITLLHSLYFAVKSLFIFCDLELFLERGQRVQPNNESMKENESSKSQTGSLSKNRKRARTEMEQSDRNLENVQRESPRKRHKSSHSTHSTSVTPKYDPNDPFSVRYPKNFQLTV